MANRPPRLTRIFDEYDNPLWFVTFNTHDRARVLANDCVHQSFRTFCSAVADRDICVGRYVLMPDHAHLFVCGPRAFCLAPWVRALKISLSRALAIDRPHWQEGFFDHLIRREESYAEKWEYVRQNPVRAELVPTADHWPYQGEIQRLPFC